MLTAGHGGLLEQAAVIGQPGDKWRQVVTAYVVHADEHLTAERTDAYC
ncbi:MAG: hypothetical protein ACOC71_08725 [Hyphomicrobiales bacterium]